MEDEATFDESNAVPPLDEAQLRELLEEVGQADKGVRLGAKEMAEIQAYQEEISNWRGQRSVLTSKPSAAAEEEKEETKGRNKRKAKEEKASALPPSASKDGGGHVAMHNHGKMFNFNALVEHLLTPEQRTQGPDYLAECLLGVTIAHLQSVGMTTTQPLECLTNITTLHLQHNMIDDLSGLEFMDKLEVLVLAYNDVSTLQDIALLPALTLLDVSHNAIPESFDAAKELPNSENLRVLALHDTPFAVRSDYRGLLLAACPGLLQLDDEILVQHTDEGDEEGEGATAAAAAIGDDEQEEDGGAFLPSRRTEDDDEDEDEMLRGTVHVDPAKDAVVMRKHATNTPTDDGEDDDGGDDDGTKQHEQKRGGRTAATATSETTSYEVEGGMTSNVRSITTDLLLQYERQLRENDETSRNLEKENDNDDDLRNDAGSNRLKQQELRRDLRFAQNHHNKLAVADIESSYSTGIAKLRDSRLASQQRRAELEMLRSRPSAAYTSALEQLQELAGPGKSLDAIRSAALKKEEEEKAKEKQKEEAEAAAAASAEGNVE